MHPPESLHRSLPVLGLLFAASLWGIIWYPLRLLETHGLAGLWSTLTSYAAALVPLLWLFVRRLPAVRRDLWGLLMLGLAGGWCNVSFILAVLDGNVVRVLLLFYLSPFWALCLGWLVLGERPTRASLAVLVLAMAGALTMLWDPRIGVPWPRDTADWLAASSGFTFALTNLYVRRLQAIDVWMKSVVTWLGCVLIALVWILLSDTAAPGATTGAWIGAAALGLFGFLSMTVAVQYGVTHMPLHRSAVILLFELVVGAVSSQLLTDEQVLTREWLGGGMILLAAFQAARTSRA